MLTHDEATPHTPLTIQLAEIIGQLQHLIDLSESASGRNIYDPLIVDLSGGTSQTFALPAESHTVETVTLSSDTAATVRLYRVDQRSGPAGTLIGQATLPAAGPGITLRLNCPIPPSAASLKVTTSVAVTNGACVVTLARLSSGRYPDVG